MNIFNIMNVMATGKEIRMNIRLDKVIDQIRWDMKRGVVEKISIDYILDRAEEILNDEEFGDFVEAKECITVYQSA